MARYDALPPNLPPRGLCRVGAAQYVGISPGKFDELVTDGLRKAAARRLAEAGCSAHQIAAVTGHRTLREIERYTQAADQVIRAEAAMAKIS